MDPRAIQRGSGTFRVRTSETAATRRNPVPSANRIAAKASTSAQGGLVISSVPQEGYHQRASPSRAITHSWSPVSKSSARQRPIAWCNGSCVKMWIIM